MVSHREIGLNEDIDARIADHVVIMYKNRITQRMLEPFWCSF